MDKTRTGLNSITNKTPLIDEFVIDSMRSILKFGVLDSIASQREWEERRKTITPLEGVELEQHLINLGNDLDENGTDPWGEVNKRLDNINNYCTSKDLRNARVFGKPYNAVDAAIPYVYYGLKRDPIGLISYKLPELTRSALKFGVLDSIASQREWEERQKTISPLEGIELEQHLINLGKELDENGTDPWGEIKRRKMIIENYTSESDLENAKIFGLSYKAVDKSIPYLFSIGDKQKLMYQFIKDRFGPILKEPDYSSGNNTNAKENVQPKKPFLDGKFECRDSSNIPINIKHPNSPLPDSQKNSHNNSSNITININGYNKSTKEIVNELVPPLKLALANM